MLLTPSPHNLAFDQRWVNIRLKALQDNIRAIKAALAPQSPKLMAVVKADAYGHGAAGVASALRDAGADAFGVTTLGEALELVDAGISSAATPILLFAPLTDSEQVKAAVENGLHLTVCDQETLAIAIQGGAPHETLHLKIDIGMGRLGIPPREAKALAETIKYWAGVYTHFPNAGERSLDRTQQQLAQFLEFCETTKTAFGLRHCANSAAALRIPEARLDMVRIGTALYGQMPSEFVPKPSGLQAQTFEAQARIVFVHDLAAGASVGYGSEFKTKKPMRVAVVPIGFADGFATAPTSLYRGWRGVKHALKGRSPYVTIKGQRAQVLGRVAMQMIVVDVTDHKEQAHIGDIADIPIRRLGASARLPRRYE